MKKHIQKALDFFRNSIWLIKSPFLASLLSNFSTICAHLLSKFANESAQKSSIFSTKASFERSLFPIFTIIFHLLYLEQISANSQRFPSGNPRNCFSNDISKEIDEYLISDDHSIKQKLDSIFSNRKVIKNLRSMKEAGFEFLQAENRFKIIVATHPQIPGYIIKAYLDDNTKERSASIRLIRRMRGCRLIHESIKRHQYEHFFTSPQKWLYRLPESSELEESESHRTLILIANKMDLVNKYKNMMLWKSRRVTKELLNAFHTIITEVGLADTKPHNCAFCQDGKIAFIDTESCGRRLKYDKLAPYLRPLMKSYWLNLNENSDKE